MITKRRHFGGDQKAAILKRYLVEKVSISDLCDEYGIQPNQVYQWQQALFENAATVFQQAGGRARAEAAASEEKVARLEAKLHEKNEVIAELMEANVRAKKANGELFPLCSGIGTKAINLRGRDAATTGRRHSALTSPNVQDSISR